MRKIYRKIYIVIGGESTGTRMVTKLMLDGGCWGDHTHWQRMDDLVRENQFERIKSITEVTPIVWRRSFPHDKKFPDIARDLVRPLQDGCGFEDRDFFFLVTARDWFCASRSAAIRGHSSTPQGAMDKLREAYCNIFRFLDTFSSFDYYMVSYDSIIRYPVYAVPILFRQAEMYVPINKTPNIIKDIVDNNYKHFHGFKRDAWWKKVEEIEQKETA